MDHTSSGTGRMLYNCPATDGSTPTLMANSLRLIQFLIAFKTHIYVGHFLRKGLSLPFDFAVGVHFDHMSRWHKIHVLEKLFYADRILFDQGGLQKDNQRQLGLAGQEKPDMISFCHIMWHGNDFIFATWKVLSPGNAKYIFFALHITWCLIKLSIFYYQ